MQQRQAAERELLARQRAEIVALNENRKSVADAERQGKEATEKLAAITAELKQTKTDIEQDEQDWSDSKDSPLHMSEFAIATFCNQNPIMQRNVDHCMCVYRCVYVCVGA